MTTTPIDSPTPSSHPLNTIMATVLVITIATQIMARVDSRILPVAMSKMRNEKLTAVMMPFVADYTMALSDSIQHQKIPAVCEPDCKDLGAFSLKSSKNFYHLL